MLRTMMKSKIHRATDHEVAGGDVNEIQPRVVFVDNENHLIGTGSDPAETRAGVSLTPRR